MNRIELEKKVFDLAERADWDIDRLDIGITISIAMTDEQRNDLAAMIDFLESRKDSLDSIMANVMHDLSGLKAIYLKDPSGNCFSPRSDGYAKRKAS
jgi:catechol-2,3-dioxygenase